jgi:hypothetical protein
LDSATMDTFFASRAPVTCPDIGTITTTNPQIL